MFYDEIQKYDWDETTQQIMGKTDADVRRALSKSHLSVDDFMALVSPAADKYLEPMARLSQRITRERFGKTINMFIPVVKHLWKYAYLEPVLNADETTLRVLKIQGKPVKKLGQMWVVCALGLSVCAGPSLTEL